MNAGACPTRAWSWRRIAELAAIILIGQLILVFALSKRSPARDGRAPATNSVGMTWAPETVAMQNVLADPAVFALVGPRGFSGRLWLGRDSNEPTLVPVSSEVPAAFTEAVESAVPERLGETVVAILPAAQVGTGVAPEARRLAQPPPLVQTRSLLRVEGPPAVRGVAASAPLPSWTNFDVLAPTTIQVLVGEDGDVISASLQPPGSGVAAADQYAMQAARLLRFNPLQAALDSPALSWGNVDFLWHTAAPEAARSAGGPSP